VNQSLQDAELDAYVHAPSSRIAWTRRFDKKASVDTKHLANVPSLPSDAEIAAEWEALLAAVRRPAAQQRIERLIEQAFHKPDDVENHLFRLSPRARLLRLRSNATVAACATSEATSVSGNGGSGAMDLTLVVNWSGAPAEEWIFAVSR
jgi:hypothetical protein